MGLQLRRGIDSDRTGITPAQGEPIYVTDTGKLYIGDGVTPGGVLVSGDVSDSAGVTVVINQVVDSAYVQARQTDFFRDSAFVTDIVDAAYIQARDRIRDSGFVEDIVDSAFVQARQITYDFLDSAEAINLIDSAYINARTDANIDSVALIAVVDSAYVQARQTPQDFAYSSLTGVPTTVSSFTNDANYLDSSTVTGVITAAYIQANQTTYNTADFTDSTYVANEIQTAINNLIDGAPGTLDTLNEIAAALNDDDSAYATLVGLINDQLDSAEVTALIDAAYVQARQITYNTSDFTDSAFVTGLPVSTFTNDANYLDSTTVQGVVDATYINNLTEANIDSAALIAVVDSAYVQARQDFAYSSLTGVPTNVSSFTNDANYLDSTTATVLIDSAYINARTDANIDSVALIALVDSAYVQARQAPGTDSAAVTSLITTTVDSAYVNARVSTVDSGQVLNIVELDGYTKLDSTDVINLLPDGTYRGLRTFVFTADSGDTTFTGTDDFGNTLLYSPQNLVVYANGILLVDSADYTATNGTSITLVQAADSADTITVHNIVAGGLDSAAALELVIDGTYRGLRTYTFTADSGDTAFTGVDDFGNTLAYSRQSLVVYVNGILLTDSVDYTALDGSTITLTNPADSADVITFHNIVAGGQVDSVLVNQLLLTAVDSAYVQARQADIYRDSGFVTGIIDAAYIQANQTTYDFLDSAETIALIDSAYVQARQITYNTSNFTDSAFVTGLPVSTFTNDAYYLDSTTVTGVIDAAYVQANQITYNTSDFADSAFVTAQINALIDGAPTTLDTLNEIAAALNDDDSAYATLVNLIGTKTDFDSADAISLITGYGYSTYDSTNAAAQIEAYGYLTSAIDSTGVIALITANDQQRDSAFVTGIIDSAYIAARVAAGTDSATVISIVESTVDSAYINARVAAGTDSATVISLAQGAIDSDYVLARIPDATLQGVNQFEFLADSGQTVFTGADRDGNNLTYNATDVLVFLNGTLMVPGNDFNTTNSNTITFTEGVDSGDFVNIFNFTAGRAVGGGVSEVNHFDFTADSGQTSFSGADDNGSILSFIGNDNIQVFINGILLKQTDYSVTNNNTVTLADGADSADEVRIIAYDTYSQRVAIDTYNFTADSGQTVFTGLADDGNTLVFSPGNLQVHLNGIMLRSGNDFSTSGTGTVTLVSGADSGDTLTVTAISGDSAGYATIVPAIVDSAYINARVVIPDAGVDSAAVVSIITADGFTKYDSDDTIGLVDSAYISSRFPTGGSSNVIVPFAFAFVNTTSNGSGTGVSWSNWNSGNSTLDFTFDVAQPNSNYAVVTESETFDDYFVGISNKTTTGFRAEFYDNSGSRTPSSFSPFTFLVYGSNPQQRIAGLVGDYLDSSTANALIGSTIDSAYIQARQTTYSTADFADSAFVTAQINALIDGAPGTLDTLNEIAAALNDDDSAYTTLVNLINAKSDLDSADAIALIATQGYLTDAIDSARITSMLAADSFSIGGTVIGDGKVEVFTSSGSPSYIDLYCEVGNVHRTRVKSDVHANYSGQVDLTLPTTSGTLALTSDVVDSAAIITLIQANDQQRDSAFVTGIIDSAYIAARTSAGTDSASVIALITSTVDSAYVALREANAGGGSVDSAAIISLIQSTVDSAYVTARDPGGSGGVTFKTFQFAADSGQTTFTGTDDLGNSLAFVPNQYQVYRNGILLIDSDDYNGTGGSIVTLTDTSVLGDQITIATYTATVGSSINTYDYFADSGQTSFSGADIDGNTLSFTGSNVLVHVNGLLLTDSNDYTRVGGSTITFDNGLDSGDIVSIIAVTDAVTSSGTDSATVVTLIEGTVDSAYIAARSAPGTDSATVQSIVQGLVDSAYVQARQSFTTGLLVDNYSYTADSAQTVFSGADNSSNTLRYTAGEIQVFRNGILLVDSDDYTASNGTSITLTSGANLGDNLSVTAFSSADQVVQLNTFEYTADSGATSFSGTDDFGNSLTYNVGNILVHLNGILLTDSADYTANNGTTITLLTAADSADIVHISTFGTATALNKWRETAVSYTTEAGTKLIVDTSSGAVTVTLPSAPVFGDEVKIIDGTGNAASNNITINRNGNKILGADSDFTIDVDRTAVDLVYYNASNGWIISGNT